MSEPGRPPIRIYGEERWIEVTAGELALRVRVIAYEGRLRCAAIHVQHGADEPVTAAMLRSLPLSRIEALLNMEEHRG